VTYYANSKAWRTSEISRDFMGALDASLGALGSKMLLFIDNYAPLAPDTLLEECKGGF
jgi:hypothetical protein